MYYKISRICTKSRDLLQIKRKNKNTRCGLYKNTILYSQKKLYRKVTNVSTWPNITCIEETKLTFVGTLKSYLATGNCEELYCANLLKKAIMALEMMTVHNSLYKMWLRLET